METKICENIKHLRKELGITQEMLAEHCGVSVQAVSKWETSQSIPDVSALPAIADYFNVSMDELFFGESADLPVMPPMQVPTKGTRAISMDELFCGGNAGMDVSGIPQDDELYIVQVINGRILGKDKWDEKRPIRLKLSSEESISLHVWGNAEIEGDISDGVDAGNNVRCGNVSGGINAGNDLTCGNVNGGINAGSNVRCGNVNGGINVCGNVACGNVSGGVDAGNNVQCKDIAGSIDCGNIIRCATIKESEYIKCDSLYCKGDIKCDTISGDVYVEKEIDGFED